MSLVEDSISETTLRIRSRSVPDCSSWTLNESNCFSSDDWGSAIEEEKHETGAERWNVSGLQNGDTRRRGLGFKEREKTVWYIVGSHVSKRWFHILHGIVWRFPFSLFFGVALYYVQICYLHFLFFSIQLKIANYIKKKKSYNGFGLF